MYENCEDFVVKKKFGFLPTSVLYFKKTHNIERAVNDELAKGSYASGARLSSFNNILAKFIIDMWSNEGDTILDPFAGRARAIMARNMGRNYMGYEISKVAYDELSSRLDQNTLVAFDNKIKVVNDNSENINDVEKYDMVFSCPPYWDVEDYNKLYGEEVAGQLSALHDYKEFLKPYSNIIKKCYTALKPNGYAVWVVSDIRRDKQLIPFASDTIQLFKLAGFSVHDIVIHKLDSPGIVGCLKHIKNGYLTKSHEYVLVFKKVK